MNAPAQLWPRKTRELHNHHFDSTVWNDFRFRDDDIVIASYAKSGTTWTQQIVGQLIFAGDPEVNVAELSPWLDLRVPPKDVKLAAVDAQTHRRFLKTHLPDSDVPVYLVKNEEYYDRPELYREAGIDYQDNCERFVFFCRATLEAIRLLELDIDLIHCHDWQTAPLTVLRRSAYAPPDAAQAPAVLAVRVAARWARTPTAAPAAAAAAAAVRPEVPPSPMAATGPVMALMPPMSPTILMAITLAPNPARTLSRITVLPPAPAKTATRVMTPPASVLVRTMVPASPGQSPRLPGGRVGGGQSGNFGCS
jgi:hypothetical protein